MSDVVALAENVAQQLRRKILRGDLLPGDVVKERENAAIMNVSRTPIREAIRILSKEGLVELRSARSPIVAQISAESASQQAEVLIVLEKLSAKLACKNATEEDLNHLQKIVDHMAAHFYDIDPLDMFEIDMSFHKAIAHASHNDALTDTHRTYMERLWLARFRAARQRRNRERVIQQHNSILDALRKRDEIAAQKAVEKHLGKLPNEIYQQMEQLNTRPT